MSSQRECANCGAVVNEEDLFCPRCGRALKPGLSASTSPRPPVQPVPDSVPLPVRSVPPYESLVRLERAWRRVERLSYVVLGLSVILLLESMYWWGFFG